MSGAAGSRGVREFLCGTAPADVAAALARCLPAGSEVAVPAPLRVKLKPGRSLTVWYDVAVPGAGTPPRSVVVTWPAAGVALPGSAPELEEEARARGVLAPFVRARAVTPDGAACVRVSPVDTAFPQLVRLHDPAYLAGALRTAGVRVDHVPSVRSVRFRPGQRHVLRVQAGGPALFAKIYRDHTGPYAVAVAQWAADAFAAAGLDDVSSGRGAYVATDRMALWPEVAGRPLSALLTGGGPAAAEAVSRAGAALRALHEAPPPAGLRPRPDVTTAAAETLRAAQVIDVLLPAVGALLRDVVRRAVATLLALPGEPPAFVHGDYKCDNILAGDAGLHLLDFDRSGYGDPAADVGKFLADLRWCVGGDPARTAALHAAFLAGYGPADGNRLARAGAHDMLLAPRLAGRRAPVHDPAWEQRVTSAVGAAAGAGT